MTVSWLLLALVRSTLVLAVSLGLMLSLRRKPKAVRLIGRLTLLALPLVLILPYQLPSAPINLKGPQAVTATPPRRVWPPLQDSQTSPESLGNSAVPLAQDASPPPQPAVPEEQGGGAIQPPSPIGLSSLILIGWLTGSLAMAGWTALGFIGLMQLKSRSKAIICQETAAAAAQLGLSAPSVHSIDCVSPFVALCPQPALFLPEIWSESWSPGARQQIIKHELAHLASKDLYYRLWTRCLQAILWPQLLLIPFNRIMEECSETLADAAVLESGAEPAAYAAALASVPAKLLQKTPPLAAGVLRRSGSLKARVQGILSYRRDSMSKRTLGIIGGVALGGLILAGCLAGLKEAPVEAAGSVIIVQDFDGRTLKRGRAWIGQVSKGPMSIPPQEASFSGEGIAVGKDVRLNGDSVIFFQRLDGSFDYFQPQLPLAQKTTVSLRPPAIHELTIADGNGTPSVSFSFSLRRVLAARLEGVGEFPIELPSELQNHGTTDSSGKSQFAGFPLGGRFQLDSADQLTVLSPRIIPGGQEWNKVTCSVLRSMPGQIVGTLQDAGYRPDNVFIVAKSAWPGAVYRGEWMADGRYIIKGLPADHYQVQAVSTIGPGAVFIGTGTVRSGRQTNLPLFDLNPVQSVTGRLVDKNGKPVANRMIISRSMRGRMYRGMSGFHESRQTMTGIDGRFSIKVLQGESNLLVSWPHERKGQDPEPRISSTSPFGDKLILDPYDKSLDLNIAHGPWATYAGADEKKKQNPPPAQKPVGWDLTVTKHDGSKVMSGSAWLMDTFAGALTDDKLHGVFPINEGSLTLPLELKEGYLFLQTPQEEFDVVRVSHAVLGKGRVEMRRTRDITVTLTKDDGLPAPAIPVKPYSFMTNGGGPALLLQDPPKDFPLKVKKTDSSGRVTFKGVPLGSWISFRPGTTHLAFSWKEEFNSVGNETRTDYRITVVQSGTITGKVSGFQTGPFPSLVQLVSWPMTYTMAQMPDKQGRFSFEGIPPSSCLLAYQAANRGGMLSPDAFAVVAPTTVRPGKVSKVDLAYKNPQKLSGWVLKKDGQPLGGTMVGFSFVKPGGAIGYPAVFCQTDSDGRFSLSVTLTDSSIETAVSLAHGPMDAAAGAQISLDRSKIKGAVSIAELQDLSVYPPVYRRL